MAPELLLDDTPAPSSDVGVGTQLDARSTNSVAWQIYAFGVVLFEVITASVPYAGEDTVQVLQKVGFGTPTTRLYPLKTAQVMSRSEPPKRPTLPVDIVPPEPLRLLMEACWDNSPLKRPSASVRLVYACAFT